MALAYAAGRAAGRRPAELVPFEVIG